MMTSLDRESGGQPVTEGQRKQPGRPSVRLYVTNYNCREPVELCIRSARRTADFPFSLTVGDSGSTDGSREMLRGLERRGWIALEHGRTRTHNDWIDHFLVTCEERFAVFVHADIEFRREGWLRELVEAALTHDPVMVYAEMISEVPEYTEPHIHTPQLDPVTGPWGGKVVRLGERPACWVLLADVERARTVPADFQDLRVETDTVPEGRLTYNTGGAFFKTLKELSLPWLLMPQSFQSYYHHYGSMGWMGYVDQSLMPMRLRLVTQRNRWNVRLRLSVARLRDRLNPVSLTDPVTASVTAQAKGT